MQKIVSRILWIVLPSLTLAGSLQAQQPQEDSQPPREGRRGDRGFGGDRGRRGGPDGGGDRGFDRGRFAERMVDRLAEIYELTDEQKADVKAKVDELRAQQDQNAEQTRQEREQLFREMRELWEKRRNGEPYDEQRMQELRDQMRQRFQSSPLSWQNLTQTVESMIPADQAAKGRERLQEFQQRFQRGPGGPDGDRGGPDAGRFGRGRGSDIGGAGSWERYVARFIRRYELDDAQQAAAQNVLKELTQRRTQIEERNREEMTKLRDIQDRDERIAKMRELRQPIDDLFRELQERLEQIPTEAQRQKAGSNDRRTPDAPTTQPAPAAEQQRT